MNGCCFQHAVWAWPLTDFDQPVIILVGQEANCCHSPIVSPSTHLIKLVLSCYPSQLHWGCLMWRQKRGGGGGASKPLLHMHAVSHPRLLTQALTKMPFMCWGEAEHERWAAPILCLTTLPFSQVTLDWQTARWLLIIDKLLRQGEESISVRVCRALARALPA